MNYKIRRDLSREYKGRTLYRIEAIVDMPQHSVKAGDLGGFIEKEENLKGDAWVYRDEFGFDEKYSEDGRVYGGCVYGNAEVYDNAKVYGEVYGNAKVYDNAKVYGEVLDNAKVCGHATIRSSSQIMDSVCICGKTQVGTSINIEGSGTIDADVFISNGNYWKWERIVWGIVFGIVAGAIAVFIAWLGG